MILCELCQVLIDVVNNGYGNNQRYRKEVSADKFAYNVPI